MSSLSSGSVHSFPASIADYLETKSRFPYNFSSIFQSTSIIGYCMTPIAIMGLLLAVLPNITPSLVKIALILLGRGDATLHLGGCKGHMDMAPMLKE